MAKEIISGATKLFGVMGYPIAHTFSPHMHNAAFKKMSVDAVYTAFNVRPDRIKDAMHAIRALGLSGVNLTIPHKEICLPFLNELSHEAKVIKAVNTIVRTDDDKLVGYNTDGRGFVRSLRKFLRFDPSNQSVFLFGAGGAGKAVGVQLAIEGASNIYISDISPEQTRKLANNIKRNFSHCKVKTFPCDQTADIERAIVDCDLLVNATSCGMKASDPILVSPKALHRKLIVCDLIYNPQETKLIKEAKKRKLKTMNGLGMLLFQGAIAFELWTNKKAPVETMLEALMKQLKTKSKFIYSR